jgi:hypothetical protein
MISDLSDFCTAPTNFLLIVDFPLESDPAHLDPLKTIYEPLNHSLKLNLSLLRPSNYHYFVEQHPAHHLSLLLYNLFDISLELLVKSHPDYKSIFHEVSWENC